MQKNSQYKACSTRHWGCASGFISILQSVCFLPALLFLPFFSALPQLPCTQCARVTSFWSAFLKLSLYLDLKNKFGCTWRPQQVRPITLVQRKILLLNISFPFFFFVLNSTFSKTSSTQNQKLRGMVFCAKGAGDKRTQKSRHLLIAL